MNSNEELVNLLVDRGYIESEDVEDAFRKVDRANFIPEEYRHRAYADRPLPIAEEATISAPHMVAKNTELLEVEEDSSVVEIGSGSGYQLAILSELAGEVLGVEIEEELAQKSRKSLSDRENVTVLEGSGFGPVDDRRFDRVLYSCAVESFDETRKYLEEGGMAIAPIKTGTGQVLKKLRDGEVTDHGRVRFVPYRDG